jgi:hypothetical protein
MNSEVGSQYTPGHPDTDFYSGRVEWVGGNCIVLCCILLRKTVNTVLYVMHGEYVLCCHDAGSR